jgi:hypothetical protein
LHNCELSQKDSKARHGFNVKLVFKTCAAVKGEVAENVQVMITTIACPMSNETAAATKTVATKKCRNNHRLNKRKHGEQVLSYTLIININIKIFKKFIDTTTKLIHSKRAFRLRRRGLNRRRGRGGRRRKCWEIP